MGKASEVNSTALNRSNSFQGRRKRDGLLVTLIVFLFSTMTDVNNQAVSFTFTLGVFVDVDA